MSNTFVPFSTTRKQQIAYLRERLITLKPLVDIEYGSKTKQLSLSDFVVYAALRGADFRKSGADAVNCLRGVIRTITYYGTSAGWTGQYLRTRFMPKDQTTDDLFELKAVLEEQLEFWSNK